MTALCVQPTGNSRIKPVGVKWYHRQFDPYIQTDKKILVQKIKSLSVGQILGGAVSVLGVIDLLKNLISPKEDQSLLSKFFIPIALFFLGGFNVAVTEPPKDRFRRDLFNTAAKEFSEKLKKVAEKPDSNLLFSSDDSSSLYKAVAIISEFFYNFLKFDEENFTPLARKKIAAFLRLQPQNKGMSIGQDSDNDDLTTLGAALQEFSDEEYRRVSLEFEKVFEEAMKDPNSPFKEELVKIQEITNKGLEKLGLKVVLDFRSNEKLVDLYVTSSNSFSSKGTDQKYIPFKIYSCKPFIFFKSIQHLGNRLYQYSTNNKATPTDFNKILLSELVKFLDYFPESSELGYFVLDRENKYLSQRRIGDEKLLDTLLENKVHEEIKSLAYEFFSSGATKKAESSNDQTEISKEPSWVEKTLQATLCKRGFHDITAKVVIDSKGLPVITPSGTVRQSLFDELKSILMSFRLFRIKLSEDRVAYPKINFEHLVTA